MTHTEELNRRLEAAQRDQAAPQAELARRLEGALAEQNAAYAEALARLQPALGASVLRDAAGVAIFAGAGSPLTQALAVALGGPVGEADLDRLEAHLAQLLAPTVHARGFECFLAWEGERPAGGATLAVWDGVATLSGAGVLPAFRGRGIQGALIRLRLGRARALGCDVAASSTVPGTPSHRNMERDGFRAVYPKVVMVRDAA